MAREVTRRQSKKSNIFITMVIVICVVALCVFFGIQTKNMSARNDKEREKIDKLTMQIEKESERTNQIEEYGKYVNTKQFIEDQARGILGLIYPDEIIFKPDNK